MPRRLTHRAALAALAWLPLLVACAAPAHAETSPEARAVVERYVAAAGGRAAFDSLRTFRLHAHVTALGLTADALRVAFGRGWVVRVQGPLALDDESEPEPDVAVVPGGHRDYLGEHPSRLVASVIRALLQEQPALCSTGEQMRDFLYMPDVAAAFVALLDSEAQGPVNIASGQPVSVKDVVRRIAAELGRQHLIRLGARPTPADDPPFLVGDSRRITTEVGWRPEYDLDTGLRETISWWRENLQREW